MKKKRPRKPKLFIGKYLSIAGIELFATRGGNRIYFVLNDNPYMSVGEARKLASVP